MGVDSLIRLWDKGGAALVMIVALFLLARFIGKRGVSAFDGMAKAHTDSMHTIAAAVQSSSAATVIALGGLTERVSRMEGKVDTLGHLAVREVQHVQAQPAARKVAMATAVEMFDTEEGTPIQGVPIAVERKQTPAAGSYAHQYPRPSTKGGSK